MPPLPTGQNRVIIVSVAVLVAAMLGLASWFTTFNPETRCESASARFISAFQKSQEATRDDSKWTHHYSRLQGACFVRYTDKVQAAESENGAVYDAFTDTQYVGIAADMRLKLITCFVNMEGPQKRACTSVQEYNDKADFLMKN